MMMECQNIYLLLTNIFISYFHMTLNSFHQLLTFITAFHYGLKVIYSYKSMYFEFIEASNFFQISYFLHHNILIYFFIQHSIFISKNLNDPYFDFVLIFFQIKYLT